jgi:hypothetical protein
MKAEFELKLKRVKKKARKKLKNTEEYRRGEENQEARIRNQDEGEQNQESRIKSKDEGGRMSEDGSRKLEGQGKETSVEVAEIKVFGDREGQYTEDGYLIRHDNPNRDKNCPYYDPYSGLYILKRVGRNMVVKSYLPTKRWSRKEELEQSAKDMAQGVANAGPC